MTYLLLAVSSLTPEWGFGVTFIIMAVVVGIGVPALLPIITGVISSNLIRGSDWFAGLGVGFLAGLAAVGLWILSFWTGYKLFDLKGFHIIGTCIGISTVVCSAATILILWLIRDRKYRGADTTTA